MAPFKESSNSSHGMVYADWMDGVYTFYIHILFTYYIHIYICAWHKNIHIYIYIIHMYVCTYCTCIIINVYIVLCSYTYMYAPYWGSPENESLNNRLGGHWYIEIACNDWKIESRMETVCNSQHPSSQFTGLHTPSAYYII